MKPLPGSSYLFYAGIDPGFSGAIALMNAAGTVLKVWDMPVEERNNGIREIDLAGLRHLFGTLALHPRCAVGIEWPTTRPGEGAERSERFGRGKGYLEAFAFLKDLHYTRIAPNLWKGRLGLDGKDHEGANEGAARLFEGFYPDHRHLVRGPKGGILDGRLDALLIAHFLRTRSIEGIRSVQQQYGKNSPQMMALVMGGKRRLRKR